MNCTEVFNYVFESFNSNNIDYAIIHSYQYLPDRFDSDIDTAINVPIVIIPPEYRLAAITENPHCGTHPTTAPTTGPALSTFIISFFVKSLE